ncbi:unnamed protein product [Psylliodes chrysocephalus]|uniref:Uncharacterized protein n=1 Tax=Psylliodes chrysocephalus TaxID=3402493 RepID=A0A9P0D0J1_9CUCU|nr:unnamed protein product [Psylliodes chrysocephala]
MRQLARLLLKIKEINNDITTLYMAMKPTNFLTLIQAVKNVCVSSYESVHSFKIPSLALKLGHHLRKCAKIARGVALRKGDLNTDKDMTNFLNIMDIEWSNRISSNAVRTLVDKKMNCVQMLPITEDIIKLNRHLDALIEIYKFNIQNDVDLKQSWSKLAAAILCRIILFNKRRSEEASRMTLSQYACRPNWKEQATQETKESLTPLETKLAERLIIVEVRGKSHKNPKVPILMTTYLKDVIDLLIKSRSQVEINPQNIYVFARTNMSLQSLRGYDCLNKFCNETELKRPELLTSTKLRKYVATVAQIFNLTENESDWLAKHLGHDIRTHREHYRLHESAVELTKVSRILLAVDSGNASKYAGKSLQDINLEVDRT